MSASPQKKAPNDGLFLLEVLIDKVSFEKTPCLTDKDFRTCVTVECLSVAPLEICDDEPGTGISEYKSGGPFVKNFNNGKSCLFSLQESEISKAMGSFTIKITVSKSLPCGCLPNKIVMGEATIDMTKEFVETRNNFLKDPNNVSYQALKDSFKIRGPDNTDVGNVVMFLRISCFGKLIITKFQGSGGPPQLTGGSNYVDRSCNPPRQSQTKSDPCACGAGRGAAAGNSNGGGAGSTGSCTRGQGGLCPIAQNYYNSAPCEEPDEPCYCSGPKQDKRQQLTCRNTDPYCLHLPKDLGTIQISPFYILKSLTKYSQLVVGPLLSLLSLQDNLEDSRGEGNTAMQCLKLIDERDMSVPNIFDKFQVQTLISDLKIVTPMIYEIQPGLLNSKPNTVRSKMLKVLFSDTVLYVDQIRSHTLFTKLDENQTYGNIYGEKETTVFMAFINSYERCRTSETQATAHINKCLQVKSHNFLENQDNLHTYHSESLFSRSYSNTKRAESRSSYNKTYSLYPISSQKSVKLPPRAEPCSNSCSQECKGKVTFSTNPCKALLQPPVSKTVPGPKTPKMGHGGHGSVAGDAVCCQPTGSCNKKGYQAADESNRENGENRTVTHISIAPRGICPIYQSDPCQGPKCILASQPEDPSNPIQSKEINNPRQGVFELVVRKTTGVPELMVEWRPPLASSTYKNKCKMIVCIPSSCKPRCSKIFCSRPCRSKPCFPRACGQPCLPYLCRNPFSHKPCEVLPCSLNLKPCSRDPCRPKPLKPVCRKCCKLSCTGGCKPRACAPRPPCRPCRPRSPCPLSRYRIGTPATRYVPCQPTYCSSSPPCPASPFSNTLTPCHPPCLPCPPSPCLSPCYKPCLSPCYKPCLSPCYNPCLSPCVAAPCINPCRTSPCLRNCPVGQKLCGRKPSRRVPKIKAHRKRISPCKNRPSNCPVVRCRKIPEPFKQSCSPSS